MAKLFSQSVEEWVEKAEGRIEAVAREAAQNVAESANLETNKGGKMRVDTGFLRASMTGAVGRMPSGPSVRPDNAQPRSFKYDASAIELVINGWGVKNAALYIGWTANYAIHREAKDGFLEAAAQRWPYFVEQAVRELASRS